MLRIIFLISLTLIFINGKNIPNLENTPSGSIDVLAVLKDKVPDCELRQFFLKSEEMERFNEDITKYCSTSNKNPLICQMIVYEIEKACKLPNDPHKRPSPARYNILTNPIEICNKSRIQLTSEWIIDKLSTNQKTKISIEPKDLCTQLATDRDIIRLVRFFYHIAPRIRTFDLSTKNKDDNQLNTNEKSNKDSSLKTNEKPSENVLETNNNKIKDVSSTVATQAKDDNSKTNENAETNNDKDKTVNSKANENEETNKNKNKTSAASEEQNDNKSLGITKSILNETSPSTTDKTIAAGVTTKTNVDQIPKEDTKETPSTTQVIDLNRKVDNVNEKKTTAESTTKTNDKDDTKLKENVTKQIQPKTDDKVTQPILDGQDKKNNKPTDDDDENDNDDEKDKKTSPSTAASTTKPNASSKASEEKVDQPKTEKSSTTNATETTKNDKPADEIDESEKSTQKPSNKEDEEGEQDDIENPSIDGGGKTKTDYEGPSEENEHITPTPEEEAEGDSQGQSIDNENKIGDEGNGDQFGDNRSKTQNNEVLEKESEPEPEPEPEQNRPKVSTFGKPPTKSRQRYPDDENSWSGSFVTYFLLFTLFVVIAYLILHNKNKLMAYALEGRRSGGARTGSRPSYRNYEKLRNVNDVIPIDDTNPIPEK